ncbi:MAG: CarD family transcriptional regulator [Hyphomicrobiaceae bacterium]
MAAKDRAKLAAKAKELPPRKPGKDAASKPAKGAETSKSALKARHEGEAAVTRDVGKAKADKLKADNKKAGEATAGKATSAKVAEKAPREKTASSKPAAAKAASGKAPAASSSSSTGKTASAVANAGAAASKTAKTKAAVKDVPVINKDKKAPVTAKQTGKIAGAKTAGAASAKPVETTKPASKAAAPKASAHKATGAAGDKEVAGDARPRAVAKTVAEPKLKAPLANAPAAAKPAAAKPAAEVRDEAPKAVQPVAGSHGTTAGKTVKPEMVKAGVAAPIDGGGKRAAAAGAAASAAKTAAAPAKMQEPKGDASKKTLQRHGFRTNEYVVYPSHGVGRIVGIEEQHVAGLTLELFVITFDQEKMTLKVPTTKIASGGMRKLAEEPVVKRAMDTLKGRARIKRTMWSRRAQEYEAKINSGDLVSIAEVVRDLYRAETQPEQSYSERQLFEAALDRMSREIAAVENLDERGAVQKIVEVLAKSARGRKAAEEAEPAAAATDSGQEAA